jgi:uncharacterized membrane protein
MKAQDEDRILCVWTPVILRTVLAAAGIVLIAGLIAISLTRGQYFMHFRAVQHNAGVKDYLTFGHLMMRALQGNTRSIMTRGLMSLTLVPLVRVAFCLLFFIKTRNRASWFSPGTWWPAYCCAYQVNCDENSG